MADRLCSVLTLFVCILFPDLGILADGQSTANVVIDPYPNAITTEQGTSVTLVCRVVGTLSPVTYQWTCPNDGCTGNKRPFNEVLLIDVVQKSKEEGDYTCTVSLTDGDNVAKAFNLGVKNGLAFTDEAVEPSTFIPRNGFRLLTNDNRAKKFGCYTPNAQWKNSNNTPVTTVDSGGPNDIYQTQSGSKSILTIERNAALPNTDFSCGSSAMILGLYSSEASSAVQATGQLVTSTSDSISVSWSKNTAIFISWKRTDIHENITEEFIQAAESPYVIGGLSAGVPYLITIWGSDGRSVSMSQSYMVTTNSTAPSVPRSLTLVKAPNGSYYLNWLPPRDLNGIVSYIIEEVDGITIMTAITGTTSLLSGVPDNRPLSLRVKAVNNAGTSLSPEVQFCNLTTLNPPMKVTVTQANSSSLTVSWQAPSEICGGEFERSFTYTVQYAVSGSMSFNRSSGVGTLSTVLTGLSSGTDYDIVVFAITDTDDIMGQPSEVTNETTRLEAPKGLKDQTTTSNSVTVTWDMVVGTLRYKVFLRRGEMDAGNETTMDTSVTFLQLLPFTSYTLTVMPVDRKERCGDPSMVTVTTMKGAPTIPLNLNITGRTTKMLTVFWDPPVALGDRSVTYTLTYMVQNNPATMVSKNVTVTTETITGLAFDTTYLISVVALNPQGRSHPVLIKGKTLGAPGPVQDINVTVENDTVALVDWSDSETVEGGIVEFYYLTLFKLQDFTMASLQNFTISDGKSRRQIDTLFAGVPYKVSVAAQQSNRGLGQPGFSPTFFTKELAPSGHIEIADLKITPTSNGLVVSWMSVALSEARHFFTYTLILTNQQDGRSFKVTFSYNECNDITCQYIFRNFTASGVGYSVSLQISDNIGNPTITTFTPPSTTEMGILVPAVVGGVIIALLFLITTIVLIICCYCCCCYRAKSRNYFPESSSLATLRSNRKQNAEVLSSTNSMADLIPLTHSVKVNNRRKVIPLEEFPQYVRDMHRNRDAGFEEEYKLFRSDLVAPATVAQACENKNRYANIFAYDHSRVILKCGDATGCNYINASYIDGLQIKKMYIATQGPTPDTISDFWQMIWEQKCPVIVMVTREEEGGRKKCEMYWPNSKDKPVNTDRNLQISLIQLQHFADFEIRDFEIKSNTSDDDKSLMVKHFLYTVWPDHGVPKYATSLIKFIRRVRKDYPTSPDPPPIVVHCSAGVGRSGTYICLDTMLQRMHLESNFNVFEFVTLMRASRTFMVQTLEQYVFIHDAIEELIVCGDTSAQAGNLRIHVNGLHKIAPSKEETGFALQFKLLQSVSHKPTETELSESKAEYNKEKNRYQDCIPYNLGRPRLFGFGFQHGADYINASYIDAYKECNYFIATQSPLQNTMKHFWTMVWQCKTFCIVILSSANTDKDTFVRFWPEVGKTNKYGNIIVTLKSQETPNENYTVNKLEVIEEGKPVPPMKVTQFSFNGWPPDGLPDHSSLLKMLTEIEKVQQTAGNTQITVICNDGCGRTGTFATIYAQIERMKVEGVVNFFQHIKLARLQRPKLVQTLEQYIFCHEFMLSFLDSFDGYSNFEVAKPTSKPAPKPRVKSRLSLKKRDPQ